MSEQLLIQHRKAQSMLACGPTYYWGTLVRGEIEVVGSGKAGRAVLASIERHVQKLRETARPQRRPVQTPAKTEQPPAMK